MTVDDLNAFPNQRDLAQFLQTRFPHLASADAALSPTRGGRAAALLTLAAVDPQRYERTRNFLDGAVTHLSAYLRHGVLTLAEVRDAALTRVRDPRDAAKFINELGWRDYWQQLYRQLGQGVWDDREPWKTGFRAADYADTLPDDVTTSQTTFVCMDTIARDLVQTGYLHNHARLWFAAYVVHWRRVRWQAGAAWFLRHLVDGDPASNNLSWQWVASTFASKPYFWNRENLQRYTADAYCAVCPHAVNATCPFDRDYDTLEQTLFPRWVDRAADASLPTPPQRMLFQQASVGPPKPSGTPLLWIHTDSLNPAMPMLQQHAGSPAVFVWDEAWLREEAIDLKRVVFLAECLQGMPATMDLRSGNVAAELAAAASAAGATYVLAQRTPDPRLLAAAAILGQTVPVVWVDSPPFAEAPRPQDLRRFSRYWQRAQISAMQPTRR